MPKNDLLGFPGMSEEQAKAVLEKRRQQQALMRKWKQTPRITRNASGVSAAPIGVIEQSGIKVPKHGLKIAWVNDTQCKPGAPQSHLKWGGSYIERKRPDVIVFAGDHWDMASMCEYDSLVLRAHEHRTYLKDLDAGRRGMDVFMNEIEKASGWSPHKIFCLGNHEDRIERATTADPRLFGMLGIDQLHLKDYGFTVYPFLQPVCVGGVAFCHYFPSGVRGQPITSAVNLLKQYHMSACAGHQQGRDIAYSKRADGSNMTAIISGSFYQHEEKYLSPFTNKHWRGFYMLHEVMDGSFDEMAVSINFLKRKFQERKRAKKGSS